MFNFNIIVCRGLDMVYIKPLYTQAKNPAKPLSSSQAMLVTKHLIVLPPGARHIDGIAVSAVMGMPITVSWETYLWMGIPGRKLGVLYGYPKLMAYFMENPMKIWMMAGGTPMT